MSQIKVELQDSMGGDNWIAKAAWTSSLDNMASFLKAKEEIDVKRIVNMLADLKHSTPFESVVLRWWIKMPIATDRQFMTHRLQSSSGMSGRYRTMPSEYLEMPDDCVNILEKIKTRTPISPLESYYETCDKANNHYKFILQHFKEAEKSQEISNKEYKRLREIFRGMLPQHNFTERISIMNLRAWGNFIKLRNSDHAQPEIREIAKLMLKQVKQKQICPIAIEALERNNWNI